MQASHLVAFCLVLFCTLKLASPMPWPSLGKSPPIGNYTIKDSKGNVCQMMQFAASYTLTTDYDPPKTVAIDPSRAYAKGDCNADGYRSIVIFLNDQSLPKPEVWYFKMSFNKTDTAYNLTSLNVSWAWPSGYIWISAESPRNYWDRCVTLGSAYNCTTPLVSDLGDVTITIWSQHLQPYAENAKGAFGPNQYCTDKPPANCGKNDFHNVSYARRKETKALGYDLL